MIRLAVRVARAQAELVLAELLELAPAGVEEVELGDQTEFAVYGAPGELPSLPALRAAAGGALVEIDTSEIADDWDQRWREFHRPVLIAAPPGCGGRAPAALRVRPPWEPAQDAGGDLHEIVIDPGQAFGTGGHATTRLCLELLLELAGRDDPPGGALLDIGTGSGVLAIAAAKLGYAPVLALDNDPASIEAARVNAALNGVELQARRYDLRSREQLGADLAGTAVTSNLLRILLLDLAASLPSPPRELIASGLLAGEASEVAAAFARRLGMRERERRSSGEWEALWLGAA